LLIRDLAIGEEEKSERATRVLVMKSLKMTQPSNWQRAILHVAHVAQLAEHVLGKDEVTRSIRVVGSTKDSDE
jgi:hypothetical protein